MQAILIDRIIVFSRAVNCGHMWGLRGIVVHDFMTSSSKEKVLLKTEKSLSITTMVRSKKRKKDTSDNANTCSKSKRSVQETVLPFVMDRTTGLWKEYNNISGEPISIAIKGKADNPQLMVSLDTAKLQIIKSNFVSQLESLSFLAKTLG